MTNEEYIHWLNLLNENLPFDELVEENGEKMDMHEMIWELCEKLGQEPITGHWKGKRMSIEEVIERFRHNAEYERSNGNLGGCLEFRQLADWLKDYKRLSEEKPEADSEYISKEKVIDILDYWYDRDSDGYIQATKSINELPSVIPQPKTDVLDKIINDMQELRGCSCDNSDGIINDVEDIIDKYRHEV